MSKMNPSFVSPEPGQKVAGYEIRRVLGRGSVSEVYEAYSPDMKLEVALKLIVPSLNSEAEASAWERRFIEEMQGVVELDHPNITRTLDFGVRGDAYFIVMELVRGTSLRDLLSQGRKGLPEDQAVKIFRQVADAVAYAHGKGVLHQDIRPGNILMAGHTQPMVVDFGLMRILADDGTTTAQFSPRAPIYMSPEQAAGREATSASDIYSLGILLYEMVTGDVPFKGGSAARIMVQHMQEAPRPPSELCVDLDPRIEAAILQALAKEPQARFSSPRSMIEAVVDPGDSEEYDTVTLSKHDISEFRGRAQAAQGDIGKEKTVEPGGLSDMLGRLARRILPPRDG